MSEQGQGHSEEQREEQLDQQQIESGDFEKLKALMNRDGSLPPHGEADDEEVAAEAVAEGQGDEAAPEKQAKEAVKPPVTDSLEQPSLVEAEYEGKKYTVPTELKDALLRQSDYTRKTQELAKERDAAQQDRRLAQDLIAESRNFTGYYAALQQIDAQTQQIQQELQKVDWATLEVSDPIRAIQYRQRWTELTQQRQQLQGQLQAAHQKVNMAQAEQVRKLVEDGSKVLARDIPDWGPEKKAALVEVGLSGGYSTDELAQIYDPRAVKLLAELADLRAFKAEAEKQRDLTSKRVQQAPPKVVRPSAARDTAEPTGATQEIARLRRSHSDDDAVAALRKLGFG